MPTIEDSYLLRIKEHRNTPFSSSIAVDPVMRKLICQVYDLAPIGSQDKALMKHCGITDLNEHRKLKELFSFKNIENNEKPTAGFSLLPVEGFKPEFKAYDLPKITTLHCLRGLKDFSEVMLRKKSKPYIGAVDLEEQIAVKKEEQNSRADILPFRDYIITVRVHLPTRHTKYSNEWHKSISPHVSQELNCVSSTTLAQLKDKIICSADYQSWPIDVSENPLVPTRLRLSEFEPSSMFFIGNTFYIDKRISKCKDLSVGIRKWIWERRYEPPHLCLMEATCISDLTLRFGYPYLYKHLGVCEHLITFTQVRLVGPRDHLVSWFYPVMKNFNNLRGRLCLICRTHVAKYIVTDDVRLPYDKTFVCEKCLYGFCYLGCQKISSFSLYKYVDRVALF